jgi:anti-sigma factor RsiW
MTMQNTPHPDDERLAAYAGGDSDALADSSLVAHLSACDRCRPIVDELSLLRGALAELPDLAPSRPLRLIPPVWDAALPASGPRSWLRRLTAPAMAAGAGLVLIGAVGFGTSAAVNLMPKAASGGAPAEAAASARDFGPVPGAAAASTAPADTTGSAAYGSSSAPRSLSSTLTPSQSPSAPSGADEAGRTKLVTDNGSSPDQPWLTLLIAGVALFVVSTVLRFSLAPRAG